MKASDCRGKGWEKTDMPSELHLMFAMLNISQDNKRQLYTEISVVATEQFAGGNAGRKMLSSN